MSTDAREFLFSEQVTPNEMYSYSFQGCKTLKELKRRMKSRVRVHYRE